jgi:putative hydrolase of the HAD superfamily
MLKNNYIHLFFDLDHTLWDFESSARFTFKDMFQHFMLASLGVPDAEHFASTYHHHNNRLWALYREGKLEKEVLRSLRFSDTLFDYGVDNQNLSEELSDYYLYHAPRNVFLFPDAIEVLHQLHKKYSLHLITNGFAEVQTIKLQESGLKPYFKSIITSEEAGVKKPDPQIFLLALLKAGAIADHSLMIGDDIDVDIAGARNVGMDQVYFNPEGNGTNGKATLEISSLKELLLYL